MKLSDPRVWLSFLSLAIVVAVFLVEWERTSPGEISRTHAQASSLDARNGCAECHGGVLGGMTSACTTCHEEIARSIERHEGLHGSLAGRDPNDCAACHSEHHGRDFDLVSARSFALAGVADREHYDHAALGFALAGAHAALACKDCHANAEAALLAEGSHRFLGLSQDCASCHDDPHAGRMARACADCHGQERPFAELATFEHGAVFALVGEHARVGCYECHAKESAHSVEALAGRGAAPNARACQDCHESPHTPAFVAGAAAASAIDPRASCAVCHDPSRASFRGADVVLPSALHASTGFALDAPHDRAQCADCHASTRAAADDGVAAGLFVHSPARRSEDCAACHADPHGGQFAASAFAERGCIGCHERTHFEPPRFDVLAHERTRFPLTGAHRAVACDACHTVDRDRADAPRTFRGTPADCASCHADAHAGAFASAAGCAECHGTTSFADVAPQSFDHARWTGFVVDGAHAKAACESCHARTDRPDAVGRAFGRVVDQFAGPPRECATCHTDVHGGRFDRTSALSTPAEPTGCARCHATESFRAVDVDVFDHGGWTGFDLVGAHADAQCAACHLPSVDANGRERRLGPVAQRFAGASARCESCHSDPHAGAFDRRGAPTSVDGRVSCARCHTQDEFHVATAAKFDHALWTGFALDGAHRATACVACHPKLAEPDGRGRSWAHAAGRSCVDCHDDPHAGQFAAHGRTDCGRCHLEGPTFTALRFDHARDSRFALDAKHARLACSACHVAWPIRSGEKVIRYKPLGITCADCHGNAGGGMAATAPARLELVRLVRPAEARR